MRYWRAAAHRRRNPGTGKADFPVAVCTGSNIRKLLRILKRFGGLWVGAHLAIGIFGRFSGGTPRQHTQTQALPSLLFKAPFPAPGPGISMDLNL